MAKITIKEIADLAGVSTATVSRVLNGSGGYSADTGQRVLEVLEKNNYQTNFVAKSLRTNQSKTIGIIVPDITNEYFASIALAIENFYSPKGYSIYIYNTSEDPEKERLLIRDLEARRVDGLIYISGTANIPDEAIERRLPIVCINRRETMGEDVIVVESDNFLGGFIATEELIRQGCRNIVLIRDQRDVLPMNERHRGYNAALKKHGLAVKESLVQQIPFDVHHAIGCVEDLIDGQVEFDAIFACTDMLAIGALKALRENGKKVPEDVKVIGFDNITFGQLSYPALTTINQDKMQLAETACELLLDIIENKEKPKQRIIVLPVALIKRNTTL